MSPDRQKTDGSVRRLLKLTPFSLDGLVGVFVALEAALSRGSRGRAGLCALPSGCQAFAIRAHWRASCWTLAVYHHHSTLSLPEPGPVRPDHHALAARKRQHDDRFAPGPVRPQLSACLRPIKRQTSMRMSPKRSQLDIAPWPLKLTSTSGGEVEGEGRGI